jgi:ribokinase
MDLVVQTRDIPKPGETVLGRDFSTIPGGKGANQAVAVARLGSEAVMVGRVGDDDFGQQLLAGLKDDGIDVSYVKQTEATASGIAVIQVADSGENAITVASGANYQLSPADIDAAESAIRNARVCVLQLEIPLETVVHTIRFCRKHGVETILDTAPAPSGGVPDGLFEAEIVSPNESEAASLTGLRDAENPTVIAAELHRKGCKSVVLKLGQRGAYISEDGSATAQPGFSIQPVDTTAAGDAFTGALAVGRARGLALGEAVRYANAAGALACTIRGAQPSMPTHQQVEQLIAAQTG